MISFLPTNRITTRFAGIFGLSVEKPEALFFAKKMQKNVKFFDLLQMSKSAEGRTRTPQTRINTGKGSSPPVTENQMLQVENKCYRKIGKGACSGIWTKIPENRIVEPFLDFLQKSVLLVLLQNFEKIEAK